ncbi:MAG: VOC family protein [Pseudomonadota bacterium]
MAVPEGYRSVSAYLAVPEAEAVMRFAEAAFGATVVGEAVRIDGVLRHVALAIGDSVVMLGTAPSGHAPDTAMLHVYVDDCDAAYARALAAGGIEMMPPSDQVHGDRAAMVCDEGGNRWWIATRIETVPADEIARRMAARPRG